ncbi:MAG: hypothetical protein ACXVRJ_12630 [Gaiellaceae bacterium]
MSATTFDVHTFHRRPADVATALLSTLDVRDLEKREAAIAEREADLVRRERAIDRLERIHELKGYGAAAVSNRPDIVHEGPRRPAEQANRRHVFQAALRLRELDWWNKVLGCSPTV